MLKKICFLIVGVLSYGLATHAQDFTMTPPIVYDTTEGVEPSPPGSISGHDFVAMESEFKNTSENSIVLKWTNITDTTANPEGWILTGVCDNVLCRAEYGQWYFGKEETADPLLADSSFQMIVHIYAPSNGPNGTGIYKIQMKTLDQTDTLIFSLTKVEGTSISSVISLKDQRVSLYPNPSTNKLTVYADKSLNASKLSVFSLVGRQEFSQNIKTGTEVSNVDINGLAPGMYLLHLTDANGKLVTSRKFIKD